MDIDFPLVITLATLATGLVWLADAVLLKPRRLAGAEGPVVDGDGNTVEDPGEPVLVEYCRAFFPVLAVVLVLRSFVFEPYNIPSESMVPTLEVGDFIVVNKFAYGLRLPVIGTKVLDIGDPERGDVMVFIPPHKDEYFIKRIVGLPGDTVRYTGKRLSVNGVEVPREFVTQFPAADPKVRVFRETLGDADYLVHHHNWTVLTRETEWRVPEGHFFMMGDNRDRSADSRAWGLVPESNIVGKAVAVWMHWRGWSLPSFHRNGAID